MEIRVGLLLLTLQAVTCSPANEGRSLETLQDIKLAAMDTVKQKLGTAEEIRNTPRADLSLVLLAIDITGSFTAWQSVYERLEKDIAAARPILKAIRPSLAEITYRRYWIGGGNTIKVKMDGDTWFYTFVEKWGDCPAGCIYSEEFYVTSTAPGAVRYAGSERTRG